MVPVPRVPTSRGSTRGLYYFIETGGTACIPDILEILQKGMEDLPDSPY